MAIEEYGTINLAGGSAIASMNYYTVLGLPPTANEEEIRKNYRILSKDLHPDQNHDDPVEADRLFKNLGEAMETLKDKVKRAEFDRLRPKEAYRYLPSGIFSAELEGK